VSEQTPVLVDPNVRRVIDAAREELIQLREQRATVSRRIAVIKQTIVGLVSVFGDESLRRELMEFFDEPGQGKQRGFTHACRLILMEAKGPIDTRAVCQKITDNYREIAIRHKDLVASVSTVLNRLVGYGEVRCTEINGKRAWEWNSEDESSTTL
jgi:hypothetical protein